MNLFNNAPHFGIAKEQTRAQPTKFGHDGSCGSHIALLDSNEHNIAGNLQELPQLPHSKAKRHHMLFHMSKVPSYLANRRQVVKKTAGGHGDDLPLETRTAPRVTVQQSCRLNIALRYTRSTRVRHSKIAVLNLHWNFAPSFKNKALVK